MRRKYQGSNRKNWNQYNFYDEFFTGRQPQELQIEVSLKVKTGTADRLYRRDKRLFLSSGAYSPGPMKKT
jgi:hypothetical protein